ncbi:unnamed protein product (macronuclear) [Paramecium tetraurelia]|uniref:Uncharacterized protein n=1 Tax=Paramecium tetraurelia TaxID=5888 RepID=A0C359_PARTE|nr:uncharacterized protein GSPATT00034704001 [Paramecium tetraurelia]CAK65226.1 unnamed protein product [Paramecium tetraurelia]|eukprot:XP_001432623.1 hypothetical protein (macronuclear) [Paramecium tetraurelia strain d4-2]
MYNILLLVSIIAVIQSKLKVIRPSNLINEKIDYSIANFGIIPFGHRLMGAVDLAYPPNGCDELTPTYGAQFIMIERGDCTFVTKVRNAERAGYQLAIIGNYNDDPIKSDFAMADDGHGYQVSIPSIFITNKHFTLIRERAKVNRVEDSNDEKIMLLLKFDVVKSDNLSVIFGLNIQDRESFRIIDEYEPYYTQLKDQNINYTLVYSIMSFNNEVDGVQQPNSDCICQNKYCAFDPDGAAIGTGRDVVYEVLRQLCIFELHQQKWFAYMNQFNFKCTKSQAYSVCSQQVMDILEIPKNEIQQCFDTSFLDVQTNQQTRNESNAYNYRLDHQLYIYKAAGINGFPSVHVNSLAYRGQFSGSGIFGEICNSFQTTPSQCSSQVEGYTPPVIDDSIALYILVITASVVFFLLVGFFIFRKVIERDSKVVTQPQVNEMVSQYIKFYEGKDKQKESGSI